MNKLKVLMLNGSPRTNGNTEIALREMVLESGRIDHSESDRNNQFELNRNSQCTFG